MLTFLNLLQLVLYIALLSLVAQGILFVLSGAGRDTNFFYRIFQTVAKPFTAVVRRITPKMVADHQVPVVTFLLLLVIYAVVTFEKINLCMNNAMAGCK